MCGEFASFVQVLDQDFISCFQVYCFFISLLISICLDFGLSLGNLFAYFMIQLCLTGGVKGGNINWHLVWTSTIWRDSNDAKWSCAVCEQKFVKLFSSVLTFSISTLCSSFGLRFILSTSLLADGQWGVTRLCSVSCCYIYSLNSYEINCSPLSDSTLWG